MFWCKSSFFFNQNTQGNDPLLAIQNDKKVTVDGTLYIVTKSC